MENKTNFLNQSTVSESTETDQIENRKRIITSDNMQIEEQSSEQNKFIETKRFWILPFLSTVTFGAYFNVNFQSFVKEQLMTQMNMDTSDYSWFLLIPTLPNIVLPLVVGPFMDLVGARTCLVLFTFIISLGMSLCMISISVSSLGWLIFGKTLLAISVECQNISFSTLAGKWFTSKGLAIAFTLQSFSTKIASSVSGIAYPQLYSQHNNLMSPFYLGISFCIMNCFTSWIVFYYDRNADKQTTPTPTKEVKKSKFKFDDLKKLSKVYWMYASQCFLMFGGFYAYENYLQTIFTKKFLIQTTLAGELVSIPYWIAFVVPLLGLFVEKFGYRCIGLVFSSFLALLSIFILLVAPQGENLVLVCASLVIFGIFLSFMCAYLFPTIPFLSQKQTLGTGFAICYSCKNGGKIKIQ
ncbi:MFS transporter (macronuclear) [Tetrahymena thermophila SB210]|uniref:Lysosomal dipeptide transporter MFSD1 n=1 Tax=Tetrahymena thermophila (strain SB210) TaxID=312017 RepID=I7M8T1_TETTS|nr:MFS transporter [Tetrahymena thermophila SB210]EAR99608.2 MFS transporter [Tetrahymena thermophila SB210]|eukprot:XP_001019853.2 MFS transporter [Tetrahymena thermophila SB210]